jgi:predicted hydrocarbon binding protein
MALHIYISSIVDAVDWAWGDGDRLLRRVMADVNGSLDVPKISNDLDLVPLRYFAAVQRGFASRLATRHKDEVRAAHFLYFAGKRAGALDIYRRYFRRACDLETFCARLAEVADHLRWGILTVEELEKGRPTVLQLDECAECALLESASHPACAYQTGVIAGTLRAFLGAEVAAVEDRCAVLGDPCCRVVVTY